MNEFYTLSIINLAIVMPDKKIYWFAFTWDCFFFSAPVQSEFFLDGEDSINIWSAPLCVFSSSGMCMPPL